MHEHEDVSALVGVSDGVVDGVRVIVCVPKAMKGWTLRRRDTC